MYLSLMRENRAAWAFGLLLALSAMPARAQEDDDSKLRRGDGSKRPRVELSGSTEDLAANIEECMRAVMFPHQPGDQGTPEVSPAAAAMVCRGARSRESSRHLSQCVKRILFERSGLGSRRPDVSSEAAAVACQYATDERAAGVIEDCMKRLMYERSGLGRRREDMSAMSAASACQGTAAPRRKDFLLPRAPEPRGATASELVEECVKRLLYRRGGLGSRRESVSGEVAIFACQGALSAFP